MLTGSSIKCFWLYLNYPVHLVLCFWECFSFPVLKLEESVLRVCLFGCTCTCRVGFRVGVPVSFVSWKCRCHCSSGISSLTLWTGRICDLCHHTPSTMLHLFVGSCLSSGPHIYNIWSIFRGSHTLRSWLERDWCECRSIWALVRYLLPLLRRIQFSWYGCSLLSWSPHI